jgi:hypothetical protein
VGDNITIVRAAGTLAMPPGGSGGAVPPGNPTSITVSGFIDGRTNSGELTVSVGEPTDIGDTIVGVHLWAEIPDQSATAPFVVGTSTVGDGSTPAGPWGRVDLGKWAFSQTQPWTVPFVVDPSVVANVNIPSRLYANPYSVAYEPPLVQANQSGPSPNQTFTLTSLQSGSPSAGTNITTLTGGDGGIIGIVATPLSPVNISGKLETPVLVDLTDTPANVTGWLARLVLVVGGLDPTLEANWQVVSGPIAKSGPVYAPPGDNIPVPHSFAVQTPKALTSATVWLQAGLAGGGRASGGLKWNNIVPGITPSFPITYGSTTGTTDATAIMTATIDASMAIVTNAFGVAVGGIDSARLAALAVTAAKLAASSVTATAIANAAVGNAAIANAAVDNAQIVSATITGASIASATIAGANIATATITQANMASASIGTAQIQSASITDALIVSLSASKITAGTISAVTITTATINSGTITGTSLSLTTNGITSTLNNATNSLSGRAAGLIVDSVVGGTTYTSALDYQGLSVYAGTTLLAAIGGSGSDGYLTVVIGSGSVTTGTSGGYPKVEISQGSAFALISPIELAVSGLPSSLPPSGSKQFWYDPSDGNRVKYQP